MRVGEIRVKRIRVNQGLGVCILVWVYMYDFNLYKIQFRFSKKTPHKFYEISQVICQTNRDVWSNSVAFLENLSLYTFADIFNTKIFD